MWTREQQLVIDNRNTNLLVAAAAGSGKTAVMIERIIQRILDKTSPIDIDRVLVLTFTRAAANEMKERIRLALDRELEKDPNNENLQRQMTLLNMANICTIDSFCKNVLIKNIHATDLDYNVKIADPTEVDIISYEVIEDLFEKLYDEDDEDFVKLVEYYSNRNSDSDLAEIIISLNKFINSSPNPEEWLRESSDFFNVENKNDGFYIKKYLKPISEDIKISLRYLYEKCDGLIEEVSGYDDILPFHDSYKKRLMYVKGVLDEIERFHVAVEKMEKMEKIEYSSEKLEYESSFVEEMKKEDLSSEKLECESSFVEEMEKGNSLFSENEMLMKDIIEIWANIKNIIEQYEKDKFSTFRSSKKMDPFAVDVYNSIKSEVSKCKEEIESSFLELKVDVEDIKAENRMIYPYIESLSNLCIQFRNELSKKKKSMGIIDFSDLEHYVLNMLTEIDEKGNFLPSKIAKSYKDMFVEVYTDEYQDSNLVQEMILSMVSKDDNRFMVGDVKQSIYRFRQAMPEIFMEKYYNYDLYSDESKSINRKILLYKNFRSRQEVLDGCNHVFSMVMRKDVGEIEYTTDERLNAGAVFEEACDDINCGGAVEVHLLEMPKQDSNNDEDKPTYRVLSDENEEDEELEGFRRESAYIASIIDDMVNNEDKPFSVYDKNLGCYRRVRYKDIVILMRSLKSKISDMEEIFADCNLPLYSDIGDGYFDSLEVDTIINLLKVIDNPISDIELVSVMRSPIFGFSEVELSKIRIVDKVASFYEAIIKYTDDDLDLFVDLELKVKLMKFKEKIDEYRSRSIQMKLSDFIWYILKDSGYMSYVSMLENGGNRRSNLLLLFEKARQFENTSFNGIFNFINYIDRMKEKNTDVKEAKIIPDDFDMVRVMSIHKSKGLEFPVVIVANAGGRFNFRPNHSKLSFHQDLGYGPKIFDMEKNASFDSLYRRIMSKKKEYENIAEEMRLLYVAMTRAKEKLIFTSIVKDYEKKLEEWTNTPKSEELTLSPKAILNAKSYLNWIMPTIVGLNKIGDEYSCTGKMGEVVGYSKCKWQIFRETIEDVNKKYREKLSNVEEEVATEFTATEIDISKNSSLSIDDVCEILKSQLDLSYEYNDIASKPSRISVTDIKRIQKLYETEVITPIKTDYIVEDDIKKLTEVKYDQEMEAITEDKKEKQIEVKYDQETEAVTEDNKEKQIEVKYDQEMEAVTEYNKEKLAEANVDKKIEGKIEEVIDNLLPVPKFIHKESRGKSFSNAEKGSIFHLVLQVMDFSIFDSDEETDIKSKIRNTISSMVDKKIITEEEADTVNVDWIVRFVKNPFFKRLNDASNRNKLYKEKAINLSIDMGEVYKEIPNNIEDTMIVGIIDLFFEKEDNTYVLMDYKTDYVPNFNTDIIVDRYRTQLDMYKKAMEEISGKKVTEVYIFLFSIGRYVRLY